MRKLLACLFSLFFILQATAQNITIKGSVQDTAENRDVANAVVVLSSKKDSSLVTFTRTDQKGRFQLSQIPIGKYILLVTFPRFADFTEEVDVKEDTDLGNLALTSKSTLLERSYRTQRKRDTDKRRHD
jgi:hypothetical protein